ncbi:MAG: hypothetical protein PHP00_03390 [Thiotrichaceae bacterium]|nr:hypothetical protein [Thiotrichaceae bacterium]
MSPLSAHAVNILIPNDAKQSTYAVNLVSHVGKTWTYSVSQVQGRTLSHWVLGINNCLDKVTSSKPEYDELGKDPSTAANFVGIKWNTAGGTFSFTLDKEYAETTLQAFVKTATVYNTGNITGPDCSKPVSSTADAAAKAAADKAAADAAAKAAADKAAADAAAKAAADKAAADAAAKAAADKVAADAAAKAAADKAAADAAKAAADKAAADKEAADKKAAADKEAADKAAAAKSEAEKAAAEKEASDKKATAEKEAADKKAAIEKAAAEKALADKVAAEKDKADKEAENKKASAKSEAEKEAAEKEASDKKAASEKEAADKNAANNESSDKKAKAEKEAADKKAEADKEASDKKAATNSDADKEAADKEAAAKKAVVEKEAADKKAEADKEAADKRATAEKESADKKAAAEKEAASKQTPEKAAIDNDAADKKANAEKEAANKKAAADKDCANKKADIEKEAADKKANLKTDAEKEAVDKEAEDKKTAADKDCASKKGDLDKEASDKKDAADKEASDKKDATDKAKSDKETADKAQADKAKSDKDAADKAKADKEKADKEAADKADKEKATKDAVGKTSNTLCASSANMDSYAFSNSQGHSAWIPGIATDLVFADDTPGHFTENTDGTAKFTGNLARRGDAKQGLIVDVTFTGAQATAPGEPKKELNAKAYNEGKADMSKWYFYTGFEGTLTGTGNYEGGKIHIVRMGPAFQIGNGANGKNINFGASGWFSYDIVSQPSNRKYVFYKTSEHADFNVDLSPCSEKGTATSPASSVDSEGKSKHSNASFGLRVTTPRASGNDLEVEQDDDISVDASIIADAEHVGKAADIIMVGIHGNMAFMRDGDDWKEWDGKLEHLTVAKKAVTLPSSPLPANVLKGKMTGMSGACQVRVGYRVDGKLIYNDEALKFTVKK